MIDDNQSPKQMLNSKKKTETTAHKTKKRVLSQLSKA